MADSDRAQAPDTSRQQDHQAAGGWATAAASVTGSAHRQAGLANDDFHHFCTWGDGTLVAAVADGASSAHRSAEGARAVCDALVAHCTHVPADSDGARALICAAIEGARSRLRSLGEMDEFHATVAMALTGPQGGWFAHIGDGAGFAYRCNGATALEISAFSPPVNGEYIGETYFFTQEDWRDHLRLTPIPAAASALLLMTDGCTNFVLGPGQKSIHRPFLEPVHRFLVQAADDAHRNEAVHELLSRSQVDQISDDDRTLFWAMRTGPERVPRG